MGSRFKLWTHVPMKDMLNIVHIHVNDTSDSVAFEVKYLKQSEYPDAQDHGKAQLFDFSKEEFSVDETGQKLRYKVLVKDEAVELEADRRARDRNVHEPEPARGGPALGGRCYGAAWRGARAA